MKQIKFLNTIKESKNFEDKSINTKNNDNFDNSEFSDNLSKSFVTEKSGITK
jgi:hypothetical protein